MDVEILGPLVVRRDGVETAIAAAKQRALFTLLVLRRGELVPTERLIEALWDGYPPATATKIVHGYVSQLRKAVGDGVLETRPGGYLLRIEPRDVDAARFEALLGHGRAALADGDPDTAERELGDALALWRGPALAEFRFRDFAVDEARRLDELRLLALECRLDAQIALGRAAQAIPALQTLVHEHPLRENLRRLLMLALYCAGRQGDALAAYQDARTTLVEELGIEPGASLQQLEAAILAHDPALEPRLPSAVQPVAPPSPPHPPEPAASRRKSRRRRLLFGSAAAIAAALVTLGFTVLPTAGSKPHPAGGSGDTLAFIDAHGARTGGSIPLSGAPAAVAAGDGAVWVVDSDANSVLRIDPASHAVVQTVPVGLDPAGIAVGGGSVWVANHDDNTVYRISPESDAVVQQIPVGAGPAAIAFGYGAVWVTNGDDRTLTRIDPDSGAVAKTIRTNAVGLGVTVGAGSVWVSDEANNRVVGVDPTTDRVASTVTVGTGPTDLGYGAGSMWVVNALAGTVSRVDATTLTVQSTIPVPGGPSSVSVTSGSVWVGAEFASRVYRIDPVRGVIAGSTALGSTPEGLASSAAGVWVAARASGTGHRGGRLVVDVSISLGSEDPATGDIFGGWGEPAYDALTSLRRVGGTAGTQIVPDLAAALPEPTADGTSYTFRLRPGIRYSDGRPLQAADFRRALERVLQYGSQDLPASYAHIVGAADCAGGSRCDLSRGVIVQGASSITFRLSSPDPSLFEELSLLVPVPSGITDKGLATTPVPGTGPYAVHTFVPERLVTFERNRYFHVWSAAARPDGYPDEIVYRVGSDPDGAVQQLLDGRVDLVDLLGEPASVLQLAAQHPGQVHVVDQQALVFVFLNVRQPPFDDVRVRRALNYAVDRGQTATLFGAGVAHSTCQLVPPTVTGYQPHCPYTIDPDAQGGWTAPDLATARSLVAASGTHGQAITLWAFSDFLPQAKYVVGVLDGLGYRAKVHEVTGDYFGILDKTPGVQAGMFGWFGYSFAVDMLSTLTCSFDPNPSHFCDRNIDAQIAQLAAQEPTDPAGTADLAARIDRELTDQAPWVPLFNPRSVDVTSARLGDYQTQVGQVLLDQLWVK